MTIYENREAKFNNSGFHNTFEKIYETLSKKIYNKEGLKL